VSVQLLLLCIWDVYLSVSLSINSNGYTGFILLKGVMMDATLVNVGLDIGLMSILLVAAHLLRSRIRVLQTTFIPSSIIAGFLGLLGGWQFLDWLPFAMTGEGDKRMPVMSLYPGLLVVVLFATLFIGKRDQEKVSLGKLTKHVGDTFFYNLASLIGMYGLALLFGVLVLSRILPNLHDGFALLLPAGFVGGHGTATAIGNSLASEGQWEEALTIGYTFATVGLLTAIFGGMLLINIATRRGWTRMVQSAQELPESIRRGFVPEGERASIGKETVSPLALDPVTWHVALVMVAFALAYYLKDVLDGVLPGKYPAFCLALVIGALLQKFLNLLRLGHYVDRQIMIRIGSSVSDYLIAFGIASIKITVVVEYALPLTVMILFGILYSVGFFWLVGRRIFRNFWFERSIFVYGWNTGIVGIAIMLLRVVDPKMKTPTLADFGLAYVFISIAEMGVITLLPLLVMEQNILIPGLLLVIGFAGCILLSRCLVGWFSANPHALREGEQSVIDHANG